MFEAEIKQYLLEILEDLNTERISREIAIDRLNQNSELAEIIAEKDVSFCISDCYFMIKHLLEENITNTEIVYFIECFKNEREYNLCEKNQRILNDYHSSTTSSLQNKPVNHLSGKNL